MKRIVPEPGQESVWDYPRPPRVELSERHLRVEFAGRTVAETHRAQRVLETSHPPVYYFPPEDVDQSLIVPSRKFTFCEWKGRARYVTVLVDGLRVEDAAWGYAEPAPPFAALRNHLAFYPALMDACYVDGERVEPQPGGFYGGWITKDVVGPFKGGPGSWMW